MSIRERMQATRKAIERLRWLGWVILGMVLMLLVSKWNAPLTVDTVIVAYPYDERSLIVKRNGYAELFNNGVKMEVQRGYFKVDELFQELMTFWEPLRDGDADAPTRGTVRIFYSDHTSGTYFIYDPVYLEEIFAAAQAGTTR